MIGHNQTVVGTCSICGGPVTVLTAYWSVVAPTPSCNKCGATAAENYGPVIPMVPSGKTWIGVDTAITPVTEEDDFVKKLKAAIEQGLKDAKAVQFNWPDEVHVEGIERRYVKHFILDTRDWSNSEQQPGHSR